MWDLGVNVTKILLIKTSSLGDLVHTLPVVSDITHLFPGARVDWVAEEAFVDIPTLHPAVERVVPVALRRWRKTPWHPATRCEVVAFSKRLRAEKYDVVLDHQGLLKSAMLSCLAHGPRWGYGWSSAREPLAALCYDHRCTVARDQHAIVRNRILAAQALGYTPPTVPLDYGIAPMISIQPSPGLILPERYVVCLHATSHPSKNWLTEHWVVLGRILANHGWKCLFPWGNESERLAASFLVHNIPQSSVLPALTLRELAGILSSAEVVIGMDTGLTHLAVALDRPTIALYTDTFPSLTGVLAGQKGWAVNLGGPSQIPSPEQVVARLTSLYH